MNWVELVVVLSVIFVLIVILAVVTLNLMGD